MTETPPGIVAALKTAQNSINREMTMMENQAKAIDEGSNKLKKGTIVHTAFDKYIVIEQVGTGGNGRVFSAATSDGEKVAIKFIERTTSTEKLKRFKNEINFCEHHEHKNIVAIQDRGYAYLDNKDYVFYVMPLYYETLKDKIKTGIPHEKILGIFIGLLEGLKFAHEHGSIHRDIKPENIMFSEGSFEPIICDFGIAHFAEEDLITIVETKPTSRMANFQYAAPEQRKKGGNVCFQTDIYALALILNEMFTGEIPQAARYKKIKDINEDYAYLDDVFEQLFIQEPQQRLYPEDKILSEMKLLADKHQREKIKNTLQKRIDDWVDPGEFCATVANKVYENGFLVFEFDQKLPQEWFKIISSGNFNCSIHVGYEPERLQHTSSNKIGMRLRGYESDDLIKNIATCMSDWVVTVNGKYTQYLKAKAKEEQLRKEKERREEIERLEKTNSINSILSTL